MMNLSERISAFTSLGAFLNQVITQSKNSALTAINEKYYDSFLDTINKVQHSNAFFTTENVLQAIKGINLFLSNEHLSKWLENYGLIDSPNPKAVALVLAGNIPLVGFHDVLSVLVTGHIAKTKLSSKDDKLMQQIRNVLLEIEPRFAQFWIITEGKMQDFSAVIATGSNNSGRYFEYYFGRYPHIFRNNRNAVAVLSGLESEDELKLLAKDVFMYFGLGCRNVSKIFVPENYDFQRLIEAFFGYNHLINHHKYANNYEYQRAILLLNSIAHIDTGFLLMRESLSIASPIAVLHYETYSQLNSVKQRLLFEKDKIQCLVSAIPEIEESILPGKAQFPNAWDYADNVDIIQFLIQL